MERWARDGEWSVDRALVMPRGEGPVGEELGGQTR